MGRRQYYIYILTNRSASTPCVGVTGDICRRVIEHKQNTIGGPTSRYNLNQPVYCETTGDVRAAIAREKQIKGWRRAAR